MPGSGPQAASIRMQTWTKLLMKCSHPQIWYRRLIPDAAAKSKGLRVAALAPTSRTERDLDPDLRDTLHVTH